MNRRIRDVSVAAFVVGGIGLAVFAYVWFSGRVSSRARRTYTITFRGAKAGQATFEASLQSDCLGEKPLKAEKAVTVTSGK